MRRFLRAPRTIVTTLAAVAVSGMLGATLPQRAADPERWARWTREWPRLAAAAARLDLDRVYDSWWFLALVLLSGASLAIVLLEQWRRLPSAWRAPPLAAFESATYRAEFDRAVRGESGSTVRPIGRLGALGSPLMHTGIALTLVAGVVHVLLATVAQSDLYVGETVGVRPEDWGVQWPGWLASPIALDRPVTLTEYVPDVDADGATRMLSATFGSGRDAAPQRTAINDPARIGPVAIYIDARHGPAAFVIIQGGGEELRRVVLLREGPGGHGATEWLRDGTELRFRAEEERGALPDRVEVRAMRRGVLLGSGTLAPGQELVFPSGPRLSLAGVRWWSRFTARRDPSVPVAFAGLALALLGAALSVAFVRADILVRVEAHGAAGVEHVVVALRPRRFAAMFQEDFDALVSAEGGPTA
jgi:hypothetical protein